MARRSARAMRCTLSPIVRWRASGDHAPAPQGRVAVAGPGRGPYVAARARGATLLARGLKFMATIGGPFRAGLGILACSTVVALTALGFMATARPAGAVEAANIVLAPHRAVYDLRLANARGKRSLEAVYGR